MIVSTEKPSARPRETGWDIRFLDGVGPLMFGMTRAQVATVLDASFPLTGSSDEGESFLREVRGLHTPICHYKHGELFLIDTHPEVSSVTLDGHLIYEMDPQRLLRDLERRNGGVEAWCGFVVFNTIGVNTEGFYDIRSSRYYDSGDRDSLGFGVYWPDAETRAQATTALVLPAS